MKTAIVTGAAGFTGTALTEQLRKLNIEVYAVVRPGSVHNNRLLSADKGLHIIELSPDYYRSLPKYVKKTCDICFHLMWTGRQGVIGQMENIQYTNYIIEAAAACGCRRVIVTGSQAEYGIVSPDEEINEEHMPNPFTAYGAAKTSACYISKIRACEIGIEWIWGRIFSLIGKYEPSGRMLRDLFTSLKRGKGMELSSCCQNWDYLDVYDAADALIALSNNGRNGEIYNIANGNYCSLKEYTERLRELISPDISLFYGADPSPFVSLQPSIEKIQKDTGWKPKRTFEESIRGYGETQK